MFPSAPVRFLRSRQLLVFLACICVASVLHLLFTSSGMAADDPPAAATAQRERMFQQCLQAWDRRRAMSSSARYRMHGEATWMKGMVPADDPDIPPDAPPSPIGYPAEDTTYPVRLEWLFDMTSRTFRKEIEDKMYQPRTLRFIPNVSVFSFDGKQLEEFLPMDKNHDESYDPPLDHSGVTVWDEPTGFMIAVTGYDDPVFFAHGLSRPTRKDSHSPADFPALSQLDGLRCTGVAAIGPHLCAVLARDVLKTHSRLMQDVYYVDPQQDGAILRYDRMTNGELATRLDIDWLQRDSGIFPASWSLSSFSSSGRLYAIYRFEVDDIELDPEVARHDFQTALEPGTTVYDRETNEVRELGKDGKTLVPYLPKRLKEQPAWRKRAMKAIFGLAGLALVGTLCWRMWG